MIYNKKGVIRKLDTKTVFEFLRKNEKPLVLYGMGELGKFTLHALKQKNIKVVGLGDGSPEKQHAFWAGLEILPIEELQKKFPDALVWITVANVDEKEKVVDLLNNNGYIKDIMTFDIKLPLSTDYYMDYDKYLPVVIVGANQSGENVYRHFCDNEINVLFLLPLTILILGNYVAFLLKILKMSLYSQRKQAL